MRRFLRARGVHRPMTCQVETTRNVTTCSQARHVDCVHLNVWTALHFDCNWIIRPSFAVRLVQTCTPRLRGLSQNALLPRVRCGSLVSSLTIVTDDVRLLAGQVLSQISAAVGRRRVERAVRNHLELALQHLAALSDWDARVSWHLHASGYGRDGSVFFAPVWEAERLIRSPASTVIRQAYGYVHAQRAMAFCARHLLQSPPVLLTAGSGTTDVQPKAS